MLVVDYEIILINEEYEGAIGGGRTELPLSAVEGPASVLKQAVSEYIESNLGIIPLNVEEKQQIEEDPL